LLAAKSTDGTSFNGPAFHPLATFLESCCPASFKLGGVLDIVKAAPTPSSTGPAATATPAATPAPASRAFTLYSLLEGRRRLFCSCGFPG
jgi:hypothetical protein